MEEINSAVFGKILFLSEYDEEFIKLKELIEKYPANGFGIVNKLLNSKGLACRMERIK
jgi:hypothetical protein